MQVARAPLFTALAASKYATRHPAGTSDMTSLNLAKGGLAIKAAVEVLLREDASKRTARCTIDVFDLTTDYTVTIDSNAHTVNGTTDIEATIDLLVADVNAGRAGVQGVAETESGRTQATITAYDVGTTYDIILDGFTLSVVGEADGPDTAAALRDAINDSVLASKLTATAAASVVTIDNDTAETYTIDVADTGGAGTISFDALPATASREGSGDASVLLIEGTSSPNYTIAVSEATGTGRWSLAADATTCTFSLFGIHTGRTVAVELSGEERTITRNWTERITPAGLTHMMVVVSTTDGMVATAIGPAQLE